jgi:hypothetical protein
LKLQTLRTGRTLGFSVVKHRAPDVGIPEKRYSGEPGDDFSQQLQPLPAQLRGHKAVAGDISAGACETRHEPGPDRITADCHHNRDCLSFSFDRRNRHICGRHDHIYLEAYQLPRQLRQSFSSRLAVAKLQDDGFPFDIAKLPQPLPERLDNMRCSRWSARKQVPDLRDLRRLLRLGGQPKRKEHHA